METMGKKQDFSFIRDNLAKVQDRLDRACVRAGREQGEAMLIAVSKTKPVAMLEEAYNAGIRDFGENKVQELMEKSEVLPQDIRWHMIGHLQRNKVKYIVGKVFLIHSVDSLRLAEEISREALKKNTVVNILIEVNVAGEDSKFGTGVDAAISLVKDIAQLGGVCVKGLMTVAPYTDEAEDNRKYFVRLRQLAVDISRENIDNVTMSSLSMGMTGDYEVAAEEGAAYVRVGTGIFGERDYGTEG